MCFLAILSLVGAEEVVNVGNSMKMSQNIDKRDAEVQPMFYVNIPEDTDKDLEKELSELEEGSILINNATEKAYMVVSEEDHNDQYPSPRVHNRPIPGRWIREYQIAQSGEWWLPWYRISGCTFTGYSDGPLDRTISWSYTYTWSITAGPIGWGPISALIGASWSRSSSEGGSMTCTIPPRDVGLIWYQKKMKWGDAQYRDCWLQQGGGRPCQAWSEYQRFDAPMHEGQRNHKNMGCSTGVHSGCR